MREVLIQVLFQSPPVTSQLSVTCSPEIDRLFVFCFPLAGMKMSPSKKGPKTRLTLLPSSSISRGFAGGTKEFSLAEENECFA